MARPKLDEPEYRIRPHAQTGIQWVFWTDGRTRSVSTGTRDVSEARRWLKRWLAGKASPVAPEQPTINRIVEAYIDDRRGHIASPEALEWAAKPVLASWGDLQPGHISVKLCRDYAKGRRKIGRSNGTIIKELTNLRTALGWAVKQRWITSAPYIEIPPAPPPRDKWLTREQADRLLQAAASRHIKLFAMLALHTAARSGAILDLTWDRVNFDLGLIEFDRPGKLRTKKKRAVVPINETLRKELEWHAEIAQTDYVIEYDDMPVGSIKKAFGRAAKKAGLDCTPHTLRHTAGTWMAMGGIDMDTISRYLGHDNVRTTERIYAKYHPEYLRKAARALEGVTDLMTQKHQDGNTEKP
jgi:integrase